MRTIIALGALLLSQHVCATQPKKQSDVSAQSSSAAVAGAAAGAAAGVVAPIDIDIAVTPAADGPQTIDVAADGGEGYSSAVASNEGVTVNQTTSYKRNAPSIAQGSLMAVGCGAGANGGGSRPGGAGFLGIVWTTDQCYTLLAAAAYQAIGMPDTSCDLLTSMKSVRKAFKRMGKPLPDCTTAENRDVTSAAAEVINGLATIERMQSAPKCADCATKTELDRAFRKSHEK